MTGFALPELSPTAAPEFVDADECKAWVEHVPLANVAAAQQLFLGQLEELNRFPTGAANRLSIMEALREPANFVQIEQAKRFTNRALPAFGGAAFARRSGTRSPARSITSGATPSSSGTGSLPISSLAAQRSRRNATKVSCRCPSSFGLHMPMSAARAYATRGEVSCTSRLRKSLTGSSATSSWSAAA